MTDALQCTFEDARRNLLRDGIALSTQAKVDYFEEMVAIKGEDHLREFLKSSNVDRKKLRDKRVCEAICCAIEGLDSAADVAKWLAK